MKWRNSMSHEELSKEPTPNAPEEPAQKELSTHDSDNESSMNLEDATQCMREETHTKWCQEYDVGSGIQSRMEDQLHRLIKVVIDSSEATTQEIRESNQEGFVAVRDKLNSIYYVVSMKTPRKYVM